MPDMWGAEYSSDDMDNMPSRSEKPLATSKERELRFVTFECGHSRKLWYFSDEPPMEEALCFGPTCDPSRIKRIVNSVPIEED